MQEIDINKVVNRLVQVIADLQLKIVLLEAQVETMVESSKGGEEDVSE